MNKDPQKEGTPKHELFELKENSGIVVPKKPELYTGNDVLHKTEERVEDKYWFDDEVNPLAGLAKEHAKKEGKYPLPAAHVLMSAINIKMRKLILSELRKGKRLTETRIRAILRQVVSDFAEMIYDEFRMKEDAFDICLDAATCFWYKHPLRKENEEK